MEQIWLQKSYRKVNVKKILVTRIAQLHCSNVIVIYLELFQIHLYNDFVTIQNM